MCQEKLEIGQKFRSFEELKDFIRKYQNQERQQFTIKRSKLLSKSKVKREIDQSLIYYQIQYVCKFGQERKTESLGIRNSRTFKAGCTASISIGVSADGQHLEVRDFDTTHQGHDGSQAFFEHLPENRRLNEEEKNTAIGLLKLRCHKRFLQDKLATDYNKIVSRQDLCNLTRSLKNIDDDELPKTVSLLENVYGADVAILHEDKQFKGLYFSTKAMRSAMNSWPEIVFIDGTYKLFKRNFTLMILLVEDSDGGSRVVGVGVLSTEERTTLKWFMECFRKENETACCRVRCLMGDKDLTERDVIKELFLGIPMYICLFHTLRTFGREVSTNKMRISTEDRHASLELLDKLAKSSSEQSYEATYRKFCDTVPAPVLNYFNKNWHTIKQEWTKYSMTEGNLGNCTNNRLESINSKIKQFVKRNSTMTDFVKDFFKWLANRDCEISYRKVQNLLKRDVNVYEDGTAEQQYKGCLTKYAFTVVLKEIETHSAITIQKRNTDTQECLIKSHNVWMKVTITTCECSMWKSIGLPCRHIFAVREHFGLPLFATELCAARWTMEYDMQANKELQLTPKSRSVGVSSGSHVINTATRPKKLSISQKRKLFTATMNDMTHVASLCSDAKFQSKLNILMEIQTYWRQGHDIRVTRADTSPQSDVKNVDRSPRYFEGQSEEVVTMMADMSISKDDITPNGSSIDCSSSCELTDINLGVTVKISGRPSAASQTTLRLPKRTNRAIEFMHKTPEAKAKTILGWLIPEVMQDNVLRGEYEITKKDIEHLTAETLTDAVVDDLVDLTIVEQHFDKRAFSHLVKLVSRKHKSNTFTCGVCNKLVERDCILCNCCLLWHHFSCVKLKRAPKTASWFCAGCTGTR